jgi:hypothetical protein
VELDFGPLRVEHRRPDGAVRVLAETPSWGDATRVARTAIDALAREGRRGSVAIVEAATGEDVGEHDLPPTAAAPGPARPN